MVESIFVGWHGAKLCGSNMSLFVGNNPVFLNLFMAVCAVAALV